MGTEQNLSTVAFEARGQETRKYASDEQTGGRTTLVTVGGVLVLSLMYLKNVLYGGDKQPFDEAGTTGTGGETPRAKPGSDDLPEASAPVQDEESPTETQSIQPAEISRPRRHGSSNMPHETRESFEGSLEHHGQAAGRLSASPPDNDNEPSHAFAGLPGFGGAGSVPHPQGGGRGNHRDTATGSKDDKSSSDKENGTPRRSNRAPVVNGPVFLDDLLVNQAIIIALADLLAHASDADGDQLTVADMAASSGDLVDNGDETWTFTPAVDDDGDVTFSYLVSDGTDGVLQMAYLDLVPEAFSLLLGTDGDDAIVGTADDDVIDGGKGSDSISAGSGNDVVNGGDGDDVIYGGDGDDLINGGAGNDIIHAGDGNDTVFAGPGHDIVYGGSGHDLIFGDAGNDVLFGDEGNDTIFGGDGNDVAYGGAGSDRIDGGADNDLIDGGADDDVLIGGGGSDLAVGGTGNDRFVATLSDGNDVYDGGDGADTYDASATSAGVTVDLSKGTATGAETGSDALTNIENVVGSSSDDVIVANGEANVLEGGAGNDTFVFLDAGDSPAVAERWDQIKDFSVGDRIDVSRMDADEEHAGSQAFEFRGEADISTNSGQLRYKHEQKDDGDHTFVIGNINEDPSDDFVIDLLGRLDLKIEDFHGVII